MATMRYRLFLDDLRYPPDDHPDWRLARNYHDALWYVKTYGLPYHISFDHDLQDIADFYTHTIEFTGYDFAKWLCDWMMDNSPDLTDFTYFVHSANPVGAENIRRYMANFMKDRYVERKHHVAPEY